jgi:hypothetical protein
VIVSPQFDPGQLEYGSFIFVHGVMHEDFHGQHRGGIPPLERLTRAAIEMGTLLRRGGPNVLLQATAHTGLGGPND